MKEDYLWDKTGDDPEIKRLEDVLAVLRYQETAAHVPQSAKVIAFPERSPQRKYAFAFALAACATVVLLGSWYQISRGKVGPQNETTVTASPQINSESRNEKVTNRIDDNREETSEIITPGFEPKPVKVRGVAASNRRNGNIASNLKTRNRTVTLTGEEKYAYRQLMVALSITGSTLKIVQDKINGIEDRKTTVTENHR